MPRAGVEEGGRARQVGQRRHESVEGDRLPGRVGEATGDPQQPVLRGLDDVAGLRVAQQVPVVDGAQAEVLEPAVVAHVDGVVELAGVRLDEAVSSPTRPSRCPSRTAWLKDAICWPRTSLSM